MFRLMNNFILCVLSPRLYRMYHHPSLDSIGQPYISNFVEHWGDFAVSYLFPVGSIYCIWQRKLHYFVYLGMLIVSSYLIRAAGRAVNPSYTSFLQVLSRAQKSFNTENAENLRNYDFQFTHWPVGFKSDKFSELAIESKSQTLSALSAPGWLMGWLVAHSFGIRLIYPGVLFSSLLRTPLEEARAKYVIHQRGLRVRVEAADGNKLDTMFFDRRSGGNTNGNTLVINFEGNAGFYEIGIMGTPLEMGYSCLGFNHPGFSGSTGTPYPPAELNAAEAIFDYAVNELGFNQENIVLFAWSIGGFPASYLARKHPKIKALILDATFDDILPLALPRMPAILSGLVHSTIRNHADIRVNKELEKYSGPLRFIRRTEDEIIADPPAVLTHNRGNFLLIDTIRARYPGLLSDDPFEPNSADRALNEWLAKPHIFDSNAFLARKSSVNIPEKLDQVSENDKAKLVVSIAENLMSDFKSTHCTPLHANLFQMPWIDPSRAQRNSKL